jgi:hypothetical protein
VNWELEEALDVEWAHAIAPGAQIVLVEASSSSLSDLMSAVATAAAQPGVSVVSMSWGFAEGQSVFASDEATYDPVFNVPGVTFLASTGDYGAADPEYPAFSPNVVAVGGTTLNLNSARLRPQCHRRVHALAGENRRRLAADRKHEGRRTAANRGIRDLEGARRRRHGHRVYGASSPARPLGRAQDDQGRRRSTSE